ncbi:BTB/POZ protein, partial [Glomus cerebriforme]
MSNCLQKKLLADISRLLCNSNNHDVKIIVGEGDNIETFTAHSIILGARSKYFQAAFYNEWTKKENNIIVFRKPNIKPQVFSILLEYYYTGKYSFEDKNNQIYFFEFLDAIDELCLVELLEPIRDYILCNKVKLAQQNY